MKPQVPLRDEWALLPPQKVECNEPWNAKEPGNGHKELQLHSGIARKGKGKRRIQLHLADMDKPVQLCLSSLSVSRYICVEQSRSKNHGDLRVTESWNCSGWKRLLSSSVIHLPVHHQPMSSSVTSALPGMLTLPLPWASCFIA